MAEYYSPAISTFDLMPHEMPEMSRDYFGDEDPFGADLSAPDDVQLRVAPSGVSLKGRYWRDGRYLKAVVHVQAAGLEPKTIAAQVDVARIARALKQWHQQQRGVHIGGWPDSFVRAVRKIAKSKLTSQIASSVKSVVRSQVTKAAVGATAIVFPPVGVPAAAAYATANAALTIAGGRKLFDLEGEQAVAIAAGKVLPNAEKGLVALDDRPARGSVREGASPLIRRTRRTPSRYRQSRNERKSA